jgi:hypothetical protein
MPSTRIASIPTTVELIEEVEEPQKKIRKRKKKVE